LIANEIPKVLNFSLRDGLTSSFHNLVGLDDGRPGRAAPIARWANIAISRGGTPLLPGRKLPVFMDLRHVMSCKNFITKGLRLNISKQMS
jgi:hypothetical protein